MPASTATPPAPIKDENVGLITATANYNANATDDHIPWIDFLEGE